MAFTSQFDAIVVGSGISGGWAAKELTEKGLKVLLLERGRNIEHIKDYVSALKGPWTVPHRGRDTIADQQAHPVQRRGFILNEENRDWWCDEAEHPYVETKPLHGSQKVVKRDDVGITVRLQVKVNYELQALLLSHGEGLHVRSPENLRENLHERIRKMGNIYGE